ncbi:3-methyl-2-oxobutanoate hydroxymethyltransferase, partial [Mycobacterium sp.]|uniref:3-methyl-2-oxobutanoate hydroxymethyltransferase n=1 Tax=Mycobacterium sp. TaxID=1785 RepID=UPI0033416627|nr:ketopantoate hydroxymethyltransferase [Mycobacterium sp.]
MSEQTVYGAADSTGGQERSDRGINTGGQERSDRGINTGGQGRSDRGINSPRAKVRTHHLQKWKAEGHKWAMLTAYDYSTARVFDDAGIPVLLVGDSAANVVYGYDTTVPVTIDELIPLV